jgi:plasmid maintenance system antidote protein VapI
LKLPIIIKRPSIPIITDKKTFQPDWTVPPGTMLEEKIAEMGLTVETLATKISLSTEDTRALLEGNFVLTETTAEKLETITGINQTVWINWEQTYRDDLIRLS